MVKETIHHLHYRELHFREFYLKPEIRIDTASGLIAMLDGATDNLVAFIVAATTASNLLYFRFFNP